MRKHRRRAAARMLIATVVTVAISLITGTAHASGAASPNPYSLPAPYTQWNVSVGPTDGNPQILSVNFDSPLLQRRVVNTVYLPDSYTATGQPSAVLYALHGTVFPEIDYPGLGLVTANEALLRVTGPAGGLLQTQLSDYGSPANLAAARFVVVAPDTTTGSPFCETCVWIDGRPSLIPKLPGITAQNIPADSYLHQELYPLIDQLFNVRTDRAGTGVTGFSMGGWATMLQITKHPDDYGFGASISGAVDIFDELTLRTVIDGLGYLGDQGYGTSLTNPVAYQNFSPNFSLSNIQGTDTKVLFTAGDPAACLTPTGLADPLCQKYPTLLNPAATAVETEIDLQYGLARTELPAAGIPAQLEQTPGVHGANNAFMYANYVLPEANRYFGTTHATQAVVSYRTVDKSFSVWGYKVSVNRPGDEFLNMTNVRLDGRAFTVNGTGLISIQTPAQFIPGTRHTVSITGNGQATIQSITADQDGRVAVSVTLGTRVLLGLAITPTTSDVQIA